MIADSPESNDNIKKLIDLEQKDKVEDFACRQPWQDDQRFSLKQPDDLLDTNK